MIVLRTFGSRTSLHLLYAEIPLMRTTLHTAVLLTHTHYHSNTASLLFVGKCSFSVEKRKQEKRNWRKMTILHALTILPSNSVNLTESGRQQQSSYRGLDLLECARYVLILLLYPYLRHTYTHTGWHYIL